MNGEIAWGPGQRIVAQAVNLLGYVSIDPASGDAVTLMKSGSWLHQSHYSPDGSRIAVHAVSFRQEAMWIVPAEGGEPHTVAQLPPGTFLHPLGWSPDGLRIHAARLRGTKATLGSFDAADGTWRDLGEVPVVETAEGKRVLALGGDGEIVVGVAGAILSDVWMVENFDPAYSR